MDALKVELNELGNLVVEALKQPKNVVLAIGGLGASWFIYLTLKIYLKRRQYAHIPGPPTRGFLGFYRGNANDFTEAVRKGKVLPELFAEWRKTYGDVFKVQMYNHMSVVTADRDSIKEILIERNLPKSPGQLRRFGFPLGERFLGTGLLTEQDTGRWKHRRALFNPGFHRNVLMTFVDHFNQITNVLTEKFRTMADGRTVVHLFNEINRATLDAIALIAFGMNTDAVSQKESTLNTYLSRCLQILMKNVLDPFLRYRPLEQGEIKEFKTMTHFLRKVGREKILERVKAIQNNEYIPTDILSSILADYKDEELDVEGMVDDFMTFFVAGQETTANALSFCFLELGKNPELVRLAREEVDRVLGEKTDITYQDINELKYCSAIFKESLRLYPPAPSITRYVNESLTIKGYDIPIGTQLMMSTFVSSRDEKYFKNPLEFKPERFFKTGSEDTKIENYVYYPFSLGARNCIGQTFAQLEGAVVIAKMVQKFDIKLDPTQSLDLDQAMTLRPKDGTKCFITLRS